MPNYTDDVKRKSTNYRYVGGHDLVAGEGLMAMTSKIQRATRLFKMNIIGGFGHFWMTSNRPQPKSQLSTSVCVDCLSGCLCLHCVCRMADFWTKIMGPESTVATEQPIAPSQTPSLGDIFKGPAPQTPQQDENNATATSGGGGGGPAQPHPPPTAASDEASTQSADKIDAEIRALRELREKQKKQAEAAAASANHSSDIKSKPPAQKPAAAAAAAAEETKPAKPKAKRTGKGKGKGKGKASKADTSAVDRDATDDDSSLEDDALAEGDENEVGGDDTETTPAVKRKTKPKGKSAAKPKGKASTAGTKRKAPGKEESTSTGGAAAAGGGGGGAKAAGGFNERVEAAVQHAAKRMRLFADAYKQHGDMTSFIAACSSEDAMRRQLGAFAAKAMVVMLPEVVSAELSPEHLNAGLDALLSSE
jgi:hypothetical protein